MAWLSVSLFIALLTLLATCRLTRLVTEDALTAPIRTWAARKAYPRTPAPGTAISRPAPRHWRYLNKLLTCGWCSGFWISTATTGGYFACWLDTWPWTGWDHAFAYAAATLACAYGSALIADWSALIADWLDAPPPPRQLQITADVTTHPAPHPEP